MSNNMNEYEISLEGMDKAEVLAKLYNASKPQGMGTLHFTAEDMTTADAQRLLDTDYKEYKYVDYLKGRVMKIDLGRDTLDTRLYDRDVGEGAAKRALGL